MKKILSHLESWRYKEARAGKFVIYFLIVNLLVAGFIGSFLYIRSSNLLEKDAIESSRNTQVQLNKSVDLIMSQVDNFITQIAMDPYVESFMTFYNRNDFTNQFKISQSLNNVLMTNNYIHSISVYYYEEDKVYQLNKGVLSKEYYSDTEIIDRVKSNPGKYEWLPTRKIFDDKSGNMIDVISVIKPISNKGYNPIAAAIVNIDKKYLYNITNSIITSDNLALMILDANNEVIISEDNNGILENLNVERDFSQAISRDNGVYKGSINGEKMLVSYVTSNINGWKYISIVPDKIILKKISFIKNYAIIITLIGILLGIIASLFFSNRIYKPINAIAGLFKSDDDVIHKGDTFQYITSNITMLKEKNQSIEKMLRLNMPVLMNNFLDNLLKGYFIDKEEVYDKLNYYNIKINVTGFFAVYIVSVDNFRNSASEYSERQINLMIIYLTQILSEYIDKNSNGIVVHMNGNDVAIISTFPADMDTESLNADRDKLARGIKEEINSSMNYPISIGVGRLYRDVTEISQSFDEASEALQYRFVYGKNNIIFIDEILSIKDDDFSYPFDIQNKLITFLKQGDIEGVRDTHEIIFRTLIKNKDSYKNISYYNFMSLLTNVIKATFDIGICVKDLFYEKNLYLELLECKNEDEINEWFLNIYNKICLFIEQRKNSKNFEIVETIIKYINENYNDDLSLNNLSQQVYLSITRISKIFREEKGITIKQYINEVRMEKAKELLKNPKYKVNEVGEKVGYDKIHGFLKQFKEYTGMTPGAYRTSISIGKDTNEQSND